MNAYEGGKFVSSNVEETPRLYKHKNFTIIARANPLGCVKNCDEEGLRSVFEKNSGIEQRTTAWVYEFFRIVRNWRNTSLPDIVVWKRREMCRTIHT